MPSHPNPLFLLTGVACLAAAAPTPADAEPRIWQPDFGPELLTLTGEDDEAERVNLPFGFTYAGTAYTEAFVGTNGVVGLGGVGEADDYPGGDDDFLDTLSPLIAPFWTDLDLSTMGTVHARVRADRASFTWDGVGSNEDEEIPYTFQVQLSERGHIVFGYDRIPAVNDDNLDEDVYVGLTPGGLSSLPPESDYSETPFSTGDAVVEVFEYETPEPFDLEQGNVVFSPRPGGGYDVSDGLDPVYTALSGGSFNDPDDFLLGRLPDAGGAPITLRPRVGGTIEGPDEPVVAAGLDFGAGLGVATLDFQPGGALLVLDDVTLDGSARLTGTGVFGVEGTLTNGGEIDLGGGGLRVAADTLRNTGLVRGVGTLEAAVSNAAGGRIEAFDAAAGGGGELDVRGALTNQAGGLVVTRGSALRFAGGLENDGQLSIGDGATDLFGDVTNRGRIGLSSGATASFVGSLDQEGGFDLLDGSRAIVFDTFSGSGGTDGAGTLEVLGLFSPGSSPASVGFGGDLELSGGALIEVAGTGLGAFDQSRVAGDLTVGGLLSVAFLDGYRLAAGDAFLVFDVGGTRTGTFNGLGEGARVGTFGGLDLAISYAAGDGNDVALYAVPEPTSLAGLVPSALVLRRRRRQLPA